MNKQIVKIYERRNKAHIELLACDMALDKILHKLQDKKKIK